MTLEEAVEKAAGFYAKPRTFVGALEALGLLKLDGPPSEPKKFVFTDDHAPFPVVVSVDKLIRMLREAGYEATRRARP